jgi:hypothetical protein
VPVPGIKVADEDADNTSPQPKWLLYLDWGVKFLCPSTYIKNW